MSKKKIYNTTSKKKDNVVYRQSGIERALAEKPYYTVDFRTGAHDTKKDKPRDKSYKKWRKEDE